MPLEDPENYHAGALDLKKSALGSSVPKSWTLLDLSADNRLSSWSLAEVALATLTIQAVHPRSRGRELAPECKWRVSFCDTGL